jgi:hypothetical protein
MVIVVIGNRVAILVDMVEAIREVERRVDILVQGLLEDILAKPQVRVMVILVNNLVVTQANMEVILVSQQQEDILDKHLQVTQVLHLLQE